MKKVSYVLFSIFSLFAFSNFVLADTQNVSISQGNFIKYGGALSSAGSVMSCSSSNTAVVTVQREGLLFPHCLIKAVGVGSATVHVTTTAHLDDIINVVVPSTQTGSEPAQTTPSNTTINSAIKVGQSISYGNSTIGNVSNCSSTNSAVTVSSSGGNCTATGVKNGTAVVKVFGEKANLTINFTVKEASSDPENQANNGVPSDNPQTVYTPSVNYVNTPTEVETFAVPDAVPTNYSVSGVCTDYKIQLTAFNKGVHIQDNLNTYRSYSASANCIDDTSTGYDSFCIDPAVVGPTPVGKNWAYVTDGYVDMESDFGKAIYYLYKNYYGSLQGSSQGDAVITNVARLLIATWNDDYDFLGRTNGPYKRYISSYTNMSFGNLDNGSSQGIYNDVLANYASVTPTTVDLSLSKLSDKSSNGNMDLTLMLNLKGIGEGVNISEGDVTLSFKDENDNDISLNSQVIWETNTGSDRSAKIIITGSTTACEVKVQAGISYNDPDDVKNIAIARARDYNLAQRFLIFFKGNIKSAVSTTVSSNNNGEGSTCNPPETDSCNPSPNLVCGKDSAYLVEGSNGDNTSVDWPNCILADGAKDPGGNLYQIQTTVQAQNYGENGGVSNTTNYCNVVCKEDYAFRFPGNNGDLGRVAQGRFISTNIDGVYHAVTGVASQRTCVTSNIKTTEYQASAVNLKKYMLKQLNLYEYYYAIQKELEKESTKTKYLTDAKQELSETHTDPSAGNVDHCGSTSCHVDASASETADIRDWFKVYSGIDFKFKEYKFASNSTNTTLLAANFVVANAQKAGSTGNAGAVPTTGGVTNTGTIAENSESITFDTTSTCTYYTGSTCNGYAHNPITGAEEGCNNWGCSGSTTGSTSYTYKGLKDNEDDKQYQATLDAIIGLKNTAKANYESARNSIYSITEKINMCTTWEMDYEFAPEIKFNYAESDYIEMMQGYDTLVAVEKPEKATEEKHYCASEVGSVEEVFNCSAGAAATSSTYIPDDNIDSPTAGASVAYYNYKRIGVVSRYGNPGVSVSGATGGASYIYFKSRVPFYTYPNKGNATTSNGNNTYTLLDVDEANKNGATADGLVYPVKISTPVGKYNYSLTYKNVGQYYNSTKQMGRIMGDYGYLNGETKNAYYCVYEVCALTDPTCPNPTPTPTPTPTDGACKEILQSEDCNKGNSSKMTVEDYSAKCAPKLFEKSCCDDIIKNRLNDDLIKKYINVCSLDECSGYEIVNGTTISDESTISVNGDLQFTVKSVSLYNLFPNGSSTKGINWNTDAGNNAINQIQSAGESIYGDESKLYYSVTVTPSCAASIKEYNKQADATLGFGDYTINFNSGNLEENSSLFFEELENMGCIVKKGGN